MILFPVVADSNLDDDPHPDPLLINIALDPDAPAPSDEFIDPLKAVLGATSDTSWDRFTDVLNSFT